jgi:hypothetical protein
LLIVVCLKVGSGAQGGRRTTATTIIDGCSSLHAVGNLSSCPYLPFFDTTVAMHHSPLHIPTRRKWHQNDPIGVGAADPTAPMLTGMLFLTSWGRHRRLAGTLPYVFLCRAKTPVKLPKIMYAQIPFNCSGCSRKVYVDKIHSNFYKNNYPEVPLWVCQQKIVHILLVTGLVTHI